jgi:hypothetical protein
MTPHSIVSIVAFEIRTWVVFDVSPDPVLAIFMLGYEIVLGQLAVISDSYVAEALAVAEFGGGK